VIFGSYIFAMTRNTSQGVYIALALLICSPNFIAAQENLIEKFSEQEAENNTEAENYLQELLSHPRNINRLAREDLQRLPFLSLAQINAFLNHRQKHGAFKNIDEAMAALAVTGDTLALCREIFFLLSPTQFELQELSTRWRLVKPATVEERWLGAPYRSYGRALLATERLALGVLAERDPGEKRFDDHRLFFGYWQNGSQHNKWEVLAGNFQIEWAQGLAMWSPYSTTVSGDVHTASRRQGRGALPYVAGDENAALRGGAVTWNRQQLFLLAFASSQRVDATLRDSVAVGFDESGYHRTPTELARRKTLEEKSAGAAIKLKIKDAIEFGVLAAHNEYDKNWIRPNLSAGYFDFVGRRNELYSFAVSSRTMVWQSHFELARSRSGGAAGSAVLSGEAARLRWAIESHYYGHNFHSPHGRAFNAISNTPQNEFGYSLGLSSRGRRGVVAEIFLAKRQNLWRTASLPLPGAQLTAGARLEWRIRRDLIAQIRWQQTRDDELLQAAASPFTERKIILLQSRHSGRLKIEYQASAKLRLISRLDFARQSPEINSKKVGLALSQEGQWKWRRWQFIGRYALFDTPANAPIYQYEYDLPGVYTNFALRERGRRAYIYLRYFSIFSFDASFKLACTETERSIFERTRAWAWGAQIDWRLRP
jgi:hypothetical protein